MLFLILQIFFYAEVVRYRGTTDKANKKIQTHPTSQKSNKAITETKIDITNDCENGVWIGGSWHPKPAPRCPPLKNFTRAEAAECLQNKTVLVAGNSVSRSFFVSILKHLNGLVSNGTNEDRIAEKNYYTGWLTKAHEETGARHCYSPNLKTPKNSAHCNNIYNKNYPQFIQHANWTHNDFYGKINFVWLWDWDHPILHVYMRQPNTIVTSNAGLNRQWAYSQGWTKEIPRTILEQQFPIIWNATLHNSSYFLYRPTTASCHGSEEQRAYNQWIRNYVKRAGNSSKSILSLDISSFGGFKYYMDCNHFSGPLLELHRNMFYTKVCSSRH
jgi:hypothetical protein